MSSGDVLLFMDADITHHPRCFVTALAEMERHELDFLSLFPRMRCVSLWENAILPSLIGGIALFATPGIEDPDSPDALAAGAFLMVNSRVFHTLGGFETIKHEMLDDVALAKLFKRNGHRVGFRLAPEFLSVRLYKSNHHAFWGMTKNILEGSGGPVLAGPGRDLVAYFCLLDTALLCSSGGHRGQCGARHSSREHLCASVCDDLVGTKRLSVPTGQGALVSLGRHSGFLLHGTGVLPLFAPWRGRVARPNDPRPRHSNRALKRQPIEPRKSDAQGTIVTTLIAASIVSKIGQRPGRELEVGPECRIVQACRPRI